MLTILVIVAVVTYNKLRPQKCVNALVKEGSRELLYQESLEIGIDGYLLFYRFSHSIQMVSVRIAIKVVFSSAVPTKSLVLQLSSLLSPEEMTPSYVVFKVHHFLFTNGGLRTRLQKKTAQFFLRG